MDEAPAGSEAEPNTWSLPPSPPQVDPQGHKSTGRVVGPHHLLVDARACARCSGRAFQSRLGKVPPKRSDQRYRRSRNDRDAGSVVSVARRPGVTSVVPRRALRNEIPVLLCGLSRCNGRVGRLHTSSVRRTFPGPLPAVIPGTPPAYQALIEVQAPATARCGVEYVLPEGFKQTSPSGIWARTQRARMREDAIHNNWFAITATHRRRPRLDGFELFAITPPLPAEVRCPECRRVNLVTADLLNEFLPRVVDRWNADLAGESGRWFRSLWDQASDGGGGVVRAEQPGARTTKRTSIPPDMAMRVMFSSPWLTLLNEGASGRSIRLEDFFVIKPDRPYLLSCPDPELERRMWARAEAT